MATSKPEKPKMAAKRSNTQDGAKQFRDLQQYAISLNSRHKLLSEIIERTQYRTKASIERWRMALNEAENILQPRRWNLIKVYDEIYLDGHVQGIIENVIKEPVKSKRFILQNADGSENPEATEFFQSQWFHDIMDHIIESRFWGHSLIDIRVKEKSVIAKLVPRLHVEPVYGQLLRFETDWEGIKFREAFSGFFIEAGKERDLGRLNAIVPYALFKKNAFIAWSEYADIFGMPFRSAYTSSKLKADHDRLESALRNMGKAAYGVFIKGIEEFKMEKADGQSSGSGNSIYEALEEACNREIALLLLGNTLSTDSGKNGSRAHAEQHKDITDDVVSALMRTIQFTVNDQLIPVLIKQGLSMLNGLKFSFPQEKNKDQIVKHLDVLLKHKDVPDEWIEENLGIPVMAKKAAEKQDNEGDPEPGKQPLTGKADSLMKMHMRLQRTYKHKH